MLDENNYCLLKTLLDYQSYCLYRSSRIDTTCLPFTSNLPNQEYSGLIPENYQIGREYRFTLSKPTTLNKSIPLFEKNTILPSWLSKGENGSIRIRQEESNVEKLYGYVIVLNGIALSNTFIQFLSSKNIQNSNNIEIPIFVGKKSDLIQKETISNTNIELINTTNNTGQTVDTFLSLLTSSKVKICNLYFSLVELVPTSSFSLICEFNEIIIPEFQRLPSFFFSSSIQYNNQVDTTERGFSISTNRINTPIYDIFTSFSNQIRLSPGDFEIKYVVQLKFFFDRNIDIVKPKFTVNNSFSLEEFIIFGVSEASYTGIFSIIGSGELFSNFTLSLDGSVTEARLTGLCFYINVYQKVNP